MLPSAAAPKTNRIDRMIAAFDSRAVALLTVLGCGVISAVLEYVTHLFVAHMQTPLKLHALLDAGVIAVLTMTLASVIVFAARARRKQVLAEVQTVAELNHHVRNALQVIRDSHLLPEDIQTRAVIESVDRIDVTLRRLFPATKRAPDADVRRVISLHQERPEKV